MTEFVSTKKHLFPNSPAFPASAARHRFHAKAQRTPSPTTPYPLLIRGGEPENSPPLIRRGQGWLISEPVLCFHRHSRFVLANSSREVESRRVTSRCHPTQPLELALQLLDSPESNVIPAQAGIHWPDNGSPLSRGRRSFSLPRVGCKPMELLDCLFSLTFPVRS